MSDGEPLFRVIRGTPTAEEVAALVGVLLLRRAPARPAVAPSRWARSAWPGVTWTGGPRWAHSGLPGVGRVH